MIALKLRRMIVHMLGVACALALPCAAAAAPVSDVPFTIPIRDPAKTQVKMEIALLKISIYLDSDAPVRVRLKGPGIKTLALTDEVTTDMLTLADPADTCFSGNTCFNVKLDTSVPITLSDVLSVVKPAAVGGDLATAQRTLVLILALHSNLDRFAGVPADKCKSTMTGDEAWTVSTVDGMGNASSRIAAISVQSFDLQGQGSGNPACGNTYRPIPKGDAPVATVSGAATNLAGARIGVDAVLVLDHSGSMSSPLGNSPDPKIKRLGEAAESFIKMWSALRANECTNFSVLCPAIGQVPPLGGPADRIGVVFFDHQVNWLKDLQPASKIDGLKDFGTLEATDPKLANEVTAIKAVPPAGATSIGGGLLKAADAFTPVIADPTRKVVLLMTDGIQNTDPKVDFQGQQIVTKMGAVTSPLPNQAEMQIYPVTVGTGVAVNDAVNQQLAALGGGFMLNTQTQADDLPNLFLQVLQNAARFATIETLRIVKGSARFNAPFQLQVPVTTTTHGLAFNANWNSALGPLTVQLVPPGGGSPLSFTSAPGAGTLTGNVPFPVPATVPGSVVTAGDWTIRVVTNNDSRVGVPFNFMLLGDDAALNSSLAAVKAEYSVGGKIKLTARVNDLGQPIAGLGTQSGARVQVFVVRPGNNLGDVLADTSVPVPEPTADLANAAQRKLQAILAANPNALVRNEDVVTLADSGDTASGDDRANDGVYSALVPTDFEGNYNFLFWIEGQSQSGGRFVRQQIRTVHVRSMPDGGATTYTATVATVADKKVLVANVTPRNPRKGKLGPGWGGYFWFATDGGAPVKAIDQLDGTYTGQIALAGGAPPKVSLHFLPEPVYRADDFVPSPGTLTPANQVVADIRTTPDVTVPGPAEPWPWWVWLVLVAAGILVLLLLLVLLVLLVVLLIRLLRTP